MPWIVGIDEAGYGPNLGPFVMTSVACRVPQRFAGVDLWSILASAVRRHPSEDDGRLLIEDSKLVYTPARGLLDLETGVLGTLGFSPLSDLTLSRLLERLSPSALAHLSDESWFTGDSQIPVEAMADDCDRCVQRFREAFLGQDLEWGLIQSVVICAGKFNDLLSHWGSKGGVLGEALAELLRCNLRNHDDDISFVIDKHGGRNSYQPLLQNALADGVVVVHGEGMNRSAYSVMGLERRVGMTFQPRADMEHFCVALASMYSKYLRELLMREFNRFWQERVPGLKATAGYPVDAARFLKQIRPIIQQLGIAKDSVWRRR